MWVEGGIAVSLMLNEIHPFQLITAKLEGSIVSLEIETTSSTRRTESSTSFFPFPVGSVSLMDGMSHCH